MTIRRRLFLSNILMILVPAGAAALVGMISIRLIWGMLSASPDMIQRYGKRSGVHPELFMNLFGKHVFFLGPGEAVTVIVVILVITIVVAFFLTNRFLIRFVFRHISEPLEILTRGAEEIGQGHLDYRIGYEGRDEFAPACEAFDEMAGRLKRSVELTQANEENRKLLLAGISHDLRSPLTSIRAYTEGLIDGVADTREGQLQYLRIIQKKSDEIDRLVSQVFLYSKMDLKEEKHLDPVRLDREIIAFLEEYAQEYADRGLILHAELIPVTVYGDSALLKRIFFNLCENSVKYKSSETGHLDLLLDVKEGNCILSFSDDGPGVKNEELPRLFEIFYRSDAARQNPAGGSGLGLSIVERCAAQMDGRVRADHSPGGGLMISVFLKVCETVTIQQPA